MNPNKGFTLARTLYLFFWSIVIIYVLLSEIELLPTAYIAPDAQTLYGLNMLCIVLCLAGTWGCLRMFAIDKVKKNIEDSPQNIITWNIVRTSILGICILINAIIYYATLSDTTPLYCMLITLTGFVFCWPKREETSGKE